MKKLLLIALLTIASGVNAATTTFFLDNVWIDTTRDQFNQQMTGTFDWMYTEGDFENGLGVFTELYIPGFGGTIADLNITIDPASSLEFTLAANQHNVGVDVILDLAQALTATTGSPIVTGTSQFSVNDSKGDVVVSGAVTPTVVPIPAAIWLFGTGLIGLIVVARKEHK